jgi:hypothetical protein
MLQRSTFLTLLLAVLFLGTITLEHARHHDAAAHSGEIECLFCDNKDAQAGTDSDVAIVLTSVATLGWQLNQSTTHFTAQSYYSRAPPRI